VNEQFRDLDDSTFSIPPQTKPQPPPVEENKPMTETQVEFHSAFDKKEKIVRTPPEKQRELYNK
jgi:hypothetical protein